VDSIEALAQSDVYALMRLVAGVNEAFSIVATVPTKDEVTQRITEAQAVSLGERARVSGA
jgi:hypothetical protein